MRGHWRELGRQDVTQCRRQSGCPMALGLPFPTKRALRDLFCRILGSCTGLMQAIHILVLASKDLQREIVESGRVSQGQGCGQGTGQQGLGQSRVTMYLLRVCCSRPWPTEESVLAPRTSCPNPGVSPCLWSQGVIEVPDLTSHTAPPVSPQIQCLSSAPIHILSETLTYSVPLGVRAGGGPRPCHHCPQSMTLPFPMAGRSIPQGVLCQEFPMD